MRVVRPQPGPQEAFCASRADIAIGGGGAGGGKTVGLLLESVRNVHVPQYAGVIFRRTTQQIRYPGSLWDVSAEVYPHNGGLPKETDLEWEFPSGSVMKFGHLERERDKYSWDGAQVTFIGFDQLEHFTQGQFFYLFSRARSPLKIPSYIRATCNPDPDSFLAPLLSWWIDDDGWAIKERSGVLRYFVRDGDDIVWADSEAEHLRQGVDDPNDITSLTFIPSTVYDNPINLQRNPKYIGRLKGMSLVDRMRLLGEGRKGGNWKFRAGAGKYFQRPWFPVVDGVPSRPVKTVRYYDLASTSDEEAEQQGSDPSYTGHMKMSLLENGLYLVEDCGRFRERPHGVERFVKNTASQDGRWVIVGFDWDPGQAGKAQMVHYVRMLAGYEVQPNRVKESKGRRAKPYSAQAEQGNVLLLRGDWNEGYLTEHENFDGTDKGHADRVDAGSGAFHVLSTEAEMVEGAAPVGVGIGGAGYFRGV